VRVRGDADQALPQFIVETDGTRMASVDLDNEDIGRWLWFRSSVVTDLLGHRGFSLEWYTAETGGIRSTSGHVTHFGLNSSDLVTVYAYDVDAAVMQVVSRFASKDQASLLRLAKELIRVFSDRLNVRELRKLSAHTEKEKLGSNKLLQDVLAQKVGADKARTVFGAIVGAYDMRIGDAHPTGSEIGEATKLVGIDENSSFMRQGEQLIGHFGYSVWCIGRLLSGQSESQRS
jgi:hypothetical protein